MFTRKEIPVISIFAILLFFITLPFAFADVVIFLKNGEVVKVPVNRDDIIGISFEGNSGATAGVAWNFESGTLTGWDKKGSSFDNQPTYGDNPTARHRGQPSQHEGNYWIGTYENRPKPEDNAGAIQGDDPKGVLTSPPFVIEKRSITFLIGGGCNIDAERAELVINGEAVLKATGKCTETMERQTWDVSPYIGQNAQIRLIDASSGGWGHINFDDVRFE
ncbi:MAG: hypothetical protein JXB42_11075 [Deltaproteobacteria bacterium]|nr:hypothetical protein [Deltaproteobacteria bacterium]